MLQDCRLCSPRVSMDMCPACRSAPLTSVAQWMSGLFGHADLTPSDLVAALVLTAAAQQQRRRLQIKNALGEKLDTITEASSQPSAGQQSCLCRGSAHAVPGSVVWIYCRILPRLTLEFAVT